MTLGGWRRQARARLDEAGQIDAAADADWLMCEALGLSRGMLGLRQGDALPVAAQSRLEGWLNRRLAGEPLQYIVGNAHFMDLVIRSDARALIPRADTEVLCEAALDVMRAMRAPRVLDLCCGGGAIGLLIKARRPDAQVTLADISARALSLARENAEALGLDVALAEGDLFDAVDDQIFDVVACNPPYIARAEMDALPREVRAEPALALLGGEDGLDFYRRIAEALSARLMPGGAALFEVGAGQAAQVARLLAPMGAVHAMRDLQGIKRVIMVKKGMV